MVLFPEPLSPTIPRISPGNKSNEISRKAFVEAQEEQIFVPCSGPVESRQSLQPFPYIFVNPLTSIIGLLVMFSLSKAYGNPFFHPAVAVSGIRADPIVLFRFFIE